MTLKGFADNDCGVYSYSIARPAPADDGNKKPLDLDGKQECYTSADVPKHGDINPSHQDRWAKWFCEQDSANRHFGPRDALEWTPTRWGSEALLT
ncbi:hypothetical protein CSOJ01_11988 [Colletotrichum sojae]|uniref:Uncharacterized protein n=1 Tax=Colletotrichum sojae TaxID=2175907 RepID=A0A8H6IWH5_9PEZI|nr:hypothetical protein CSOJ01_11988 [Colletotrichum sojae]